MQGLKILVSNHADTSCDQMNREDELYYAASTRWREALAKTTTMATEPGPSLRSEWSALPSRSVGKRGLRRPPPCSAVVSFGRQGCVPDNGPWCLFRRKRLRPTELAVQTSNGSRPHPFAIDGAD
jgi:hypothetical protein